MRAVLSHDAVTMRDPSGLKTADRTVGLWYVTAHRTASSWPRRTAISFALAAPQMRAVLSHDAVTMRDPSGLKAADHTGCHGRAGPRSPWRSRRPAAKNRSALAIIRGDAQLLLDVGHHRVRQARLAEFREVLNDDALP